MFPDLRGIDVLCVVSHHEFPGFADILSRLLAFVCWYLCMWCIAAVLLSCYCCLEDPTVFEVASGGTRIKAVAAAAAWNYCGTLMERLGKVLLWGFKCDMRRVGGVFMV